MVVWDRLLCLIDVETGDTEELANLESVCPEGSVFNRAAISSSAERLFIRRSGQVGGTVRVDLSNCAVDEIDVGGHITACCHDQPRLVIQRGGVVYDTKAKNADGVRTIIDKSSLEFWTTDEDGGDERFLGPWSFAHATLIGGTSKIQGCGLPPDRCLWVVEQGKDPYKLVEGPYFWHSGSSYDGQWIASDTNWPDQGIQLVHVPTRHFRTLCQPGATQDHVAFGHPHPTVSQDGSLVLFRSDRTGVPQMYIAHVTDEFRDSIRSGDLDRRSPKRL